MATEHRVSEPQVARPGGMIAKAAVISATLAAAGSAFGLIRDLLVAAFFGANEDTDAFLVAWTVPETLAPLLIEGTMAMVMVPAFGRAIAAAERQRPADGTTRDPVRELVEATFARVLVALGALGAFIAVTAPWLIDVLTPGLADPALAVRCMRIVAITVPLLGFAGYLAAALRTHGAFGPPAAIYLAYNLGIVLTILLTFRWLGVVGAAIGISAGAALMVAVQFPAALRRLPRPRSFSLRRTTELLALAAFAPVALHTLARQAQTFVERFAAAPLVEGTISHLNYAQKVAQIPITLSFMAAAVTFPIFAKSVAGGAHREARRRIENDLVVLGAVAMLVAAFLVVFAPSVISVLFERGAFAPDDTARTAEILRVYALGLLGQTMVSMLVRPYFTFPSAVWFPAAAMAQGVAVTVGATALLVGPFGAIGIAAANAIGITATAVVLAVGSRHRLSTAPAGQAYARLAAMTVPLAAATALGVTAARWLDGSPALVSAVIGGTVMVGTFGAICLLAHRWRARRRFEA